MKDKTNKRFWQRMAKLYAPFMKNAHTLYESICERCRFYLTRKMNVLELACGSGQLSFPLAEYAGHWEATDFSEKMVAEAKKRVHRPNLAFSVQDAINLPYATASFDAVLIANALHIMPEPGKVISEIHRVLKPGGILLAPTFIWGTDTRQQIGEWVMARAGFRVFHKWSADGFAAYVEAFGFKVLERETLGGSIRPLCCLIAQGTWVSPENKEMKRDGT